MKTNESKTDINNIEHINKLEEFLKECDISKEDICLIGSTPLALHGIRKNKDIDIASISQTRSRLENLIDGELGDKIDLSSEDSLGLIGITDEELFSTDEFVTTVDGYRILRLEIVLSIKGAKRRDKDLEDIKRIYQADKPKHDNWDWNLVRVVPLWERHVHSKKSPLKKSQRLAREGIESLITDGFFTTAAKTAKYVTPDHSWRIVGPIGTAIDRLVPGEDIQRTQFWAHESGYPLPFILGSQYSENGDFERNDIIANLLSFEDSIKFESNATVGSSVRISPDGKLQRGVTLVAKEIHNYKDSFPECEGNMRISANITESKTLGSTDHKWVQNHFSKQEQKMIQQRRKQLLEMSGTYFYMVLWPAIQSRFDELEDRVRSKVRVIESTEFQVENGFGELVRDIYSIDERNESWFRDKKIHELKKHNPRIRVLMLEIPNPNFDFSGDQIMCNEIYDLKINLRQYSQEILEQYTYGTCVHATDTYHHNAHVRNILEQISDQSYQPSVEVESSC